MPVYNFTIDDTSPLITYSPDGAWTDTDTSDFFYVDYANQTFHSTNKTGASASFNFTGTALYIYGAKRGNHDEYTVTLDGASTIGNGFNATEDFQVCLFSKTGLVNKEHAVSITDTSTVSGSPYLDIDFIVFTLGNDNPNSSFTDLIVDDTASNITYSNWEAGINTGLNSFYYNSTFHDASTSGASATIPFVGQTIAIYGATSNNHGKYNVSLDGGPQITYNGNVNTPGNVNAFRPKNLLYFASGLSSSSHQVTITNIDSTGLFVDFDYITATTWTNTTTSSNSSSSGSHSHSSVGAIAGGVVGGLAALALIALFFVLCRRRRYARGYPQPKRDSEAVAPFMAEREPSCVKPMQETPPRMSEAYTAAPRTSEAHSAPQASSVGHSTWATSPPTSTAAFSVAPSNVRSSVPELDAGPYMPPPEYGSVFGRNQNQNQTHGAGGSRQGPRPLPQISTDAPPAPTSPSEKRPPAVLSPHGPPGLDA